MGLPVVSEDVCAAVRRDLERSSGNDYVAQIVERLKTENPNLLQFVATFALQHGEPLLVTTAALIVYRLLESQGEADRMKQGFL